MVLCVKSCLKRVTTTVKNTLCAITNGDNLLRNNTQSSAFGTLRLIHLRIGRAQKRLPVGSQPSKSTISMRCRFPAEKRPIQFVPKQGAVHPERDSPSERFTSAAPQLVKRPNHKRTNRHLFSQNER